METSEKKWKLFKIVSNNYSSYGKIDISMKRKKQIAKRFKSWISLIFASILVLTVILSTGKVFADSNQGSQKTAYQKFLYQALNGCISNKGNFELSGSYNFITADFVKDQDLFKNGSFWSGAWASGSTLPGDKIPGGVVIEKLLTGSYKDGKIYCGENNNALLKKALSSEYLNINYADLICNSADGRSSGGILKPYGSSGCEAMLDKGSEADQFNYPSESERTEYFKKLVEEKTFGGASNIPGGSLDTFTDLEMYYIWADTFLSACGYGTPDFSESKTSKPYQIMTYNSSTGQFELAGFAAKNSGDYKVKISSTTTMTCNEIADQISGTGSDNPYYEAFKRHIEETIESGGDVGAESPITEGTVAGVDSDPANMEKKCRDIVGALGWIMCPLVFNTAKGVSDLYSFVENNFMIVRSQLFTDELQKTWSEIRSLANIFFIVLFLIVIISQITGVGIDNYGIKRIMPRLIVVAILINLSYIACQLVTDVSNVVGYSAANTISALGGKYQGQNSDTYIDITINQEKSQFIRIVLTKGVIGAVGAGELLVVLLCLVIALLSTFIIWIFCLARDIGIIAMVIMSPLAFASLLLPNTESLYKKWFSLSKIVLTLYPICGFTIGIGTFISKFVYNTTGAGTFLAGVAALLTATLPFVAIPYLLLNALSAFGTIGNKLAGLGRKTITAGAAAGLAGAGIKRAYKNSNFAYNRQENKARKIDMKRVNQARRISNRLSRQDPAELSNRQRERLARANQTIDKDNERQSAVNYASSAGYLERRAQGRENAERRKREEDVMAQISSGTGAFARFNNGTNLNGMRDRIFELGNRGEANLSDAERSEYGALVRQMAKTKGGDNMLVDSPYATDSHGNRLNANGLRMLNNARLQNDDVSAVFGRKASVTTRVLNDVASGQIQAQDFINGNFDAQTYTRDALTDPTDIASQSGGELRRYANHIDPNLTRQLVQDERFTSIVPDYAKQQALRNTDTIRDLNIERNQQAMNEARDAEQAQIFAQQQAQYDQQVAQENEVFRVQEENSRNDTRGTIQQNINGATHTVYRVPKWRGGFTGNNGTWSINSNNEAIYTEGNLSWNGTTGRINNLNPRQAPTPPPAPGSQPDVQGPPRPLSS